MKKRRAVSGLGHDFRAPEENGAGLKRDVSGQSRSTLARNEDRKGRIGMRGGLATTSARKGVMNESGAWLTGHLRSRPQGSFLVAKVEGLLWQPKIG
jgi:hypothetical protein